MKKPFLIVLFCSLACISVSAQKTFSATDVFTEKNLMQEKVTGKPQGGSVKTYWAGAFRDTLGEIHKMYKKWKKEAMVK